MQFHHESIFFTDRRSDFFTTPALPADQTQKGVRFSIARVWVMVKKKPSPMFDVYVSLCIFRGQAGRSFLKIRDIRLGCIFVYLKKNLARPHVLSLFTHNSCLYLVPCLWCVCYICVRFQCLRGTCSCVFAIHESCVARLKRFVTCPFRHVNFCGMRVHIVVVFA